MTRWYIWDPDIVCKDCWFQLIERVSIQTLLEDKQFLVGRIVMPPIK